MEVLILLIFVSLVLAGSAVAFFAWNLRGKNHEHADRLALLPLDEDDAMSPAGGTNVERGA